VNSTAARCARAADAIEEFVKRAGGRLSPSRCQKAVERHLPSSGGTPLVVAEGPALGVVYLKDIVKGGIKERFAELRRWASRR
jgi:K+-transporting ATPase ATPase B chain